MNRNRRANLRNVISKARKIIENDLAAQLLRLGIKQNGKRIPPSQLSNTLSKIKSRTDLEDALRKERSAVDSEEEAILRYIRLAGSTFINRLAALRALEVRKLTPESVIQRNTTGGYSLRGWRIAEADPGLAPDEVRQKSLKEAFKELSQEIGALFELDDEYSLLFPTPKALKDLIFLFTDQITAEDWLQDDVIGWIYQYYNEEARAQFKKAKRALSTDDVPIINQFYTPHWVVRLLTDNTLGRFWLEQKGRCSHLKCEGDKAQLIELRRFERDSDSDGGSPLMSAHHKIENVDSFCSYFLPLSKEPRSRAVKKVREIKVLDPACGSGHFLIYAFDVLFRMYIEEEPTITKKAIPKLILENNLYGVDVDLRAVQLAALSLYLKAKSYDPDIKISKMNLVCADSHIANSEKREEFLKRFEDDPALAAIFETLFEKLNHTNELGSLLKVREPFEELFLERGKKPLQAHFLADNVQSTRSAEGFTAVSNIKERGISIGQEMAIPQKIAIEEMINELHEFERECLERQDMGSMIFATEAEKSIGLLSLLSQKYDIILTNPPYGDQPEKSKEYLKKNYPKTRRDYSAAFIEQAGNLIEQDGYIGGLVTRSFLFLKSYQWLRQTLLTKETTLESVFDLGFGILEGATARWAAFITHKGASSDIKSQDLSDVEFLNLLEANSEETRIDLFENALHSILNNIECPVAYRASIRELRKIPGMPFCYWITPTMRDRFVQLPSLDKDVARIQCDVKIGDVKFGLITGDDKRFTRRLWEVSQECLTSGSWIPFANQGGSTRFYEDITRVVNWKNNGAELRSLDTARVQSTAYYCKEGLFCPDIVSSYCLSFRKLPSNVIFGSSVVGIFPADKRHILALLALGNSKFVSFLFRILDALAHHRSPGYLSRLPINLAALNSNKLISSALEAYYLTKEYFTGVETSSLFFKPWLLQLLDPSTQNQNKILEDSLIEQSQYLNWDCINQITNICGSVEMPLKELALLCIKRKEMTKTRIRDLQQTIDDEVFQIYGVSSEERKIVEKDVSGGFFEIGTEREDSGSSGENVKNQNLSNNFDEDIKNETITLVSYYVKQVVNADEDGIIPLDDKFENSLFNRIRAMMESDFGKDRVNTLIDEISEILGSRPEEWIKSNYFAYHVDLYERRPIYWQLTSQGFAKSRREATAFSCFLNYHKLTRDTLPKIIELYLKGAKRSAATRHENLKHEFEQIERGRDRSKFRNLSEALKDSQGLLDQLAAFENALLRVIKPPQNFGIPSRRPTWFEEKTREISANGWNPTLDYGVLVNIQPLKQANLLPASAIKAN